MDDGHRQSARTRHRRRRSPPCGSCAMSAGCYCRSRRARIAPAAPGAGGALSRDAAATRPRHRGRAAGAHQQRARRGGPLMPPATLSLRDRLRAQLADLKMPGALEAADDILRRADSERIAAAAMTELLGSQITLRNQRRLQAATRSADYRPRRRSPISNSPFSPRSNASRSRACTRWAFSSAEVIVFLGGRPASAKRTSPSVSPSPRRRAAAAFTTRRSPISSHRSRRRSSAAS